MYQKPDFIKVDLDVKDNFAAYACPEDTSNNNAHVVGTGCEGAANVQTLTQQYPNTAWQCYSTNAWPGAGA